ncbi:MarR family winged helix-turn-helix transcriptional regulator [Paenibacillus piri]|uniref:MarR family transcriptional regulator n=1 Tax=Paenibacillus piri TaxID=2547395 RepID=A0A4R5KK55_9BACL|nr:MarR family transcriptional regulator [Paenibacillus piri]TDF95923.1 MarR family transcriptional regulator [Paenibacillus piri]
MEFSLQESISYWIKKIYQETGQLYNQRLAKYGLTTAQVSVLALLWNFGDGLTQKELHEKLRIRPASLTNVLDMLVAGGWVVRKQDEEDARVKRIYLTDSGKAQESVCAGILAEIERHVQQHLAPEEKAIMLMWLKKIERSFRKEG